MSLGEAIELAQSAGYATAEPGGTWRGMELYIPVDSDDALSCTGYPLAIVKAESGVRFLTVDETFEYMGLPIGEI